MNEKTLAEQQAELMAKGEALSQIAFGKNTHAQIKTLAQSALEPPKTSLTVVLYGEFVNGVLATNEDGTPSVSFENTGKYTVPLYQLVEA